MSSVVSRKSVRAGSAKAAAASKDRSALPDEVVIGKDVLELLSAAMYVEPLSIYREYVQNAADAIDARCSSGEPGVEHCDGKIDITIEPAQRLIRISDNGMGIPTATAVRTLLSIGASPKRGTRARGFRGVGRLAGLAYCRTMVFRTRACGDDSFLEMRWDSQRLKAALRDVNQNDALTEIIDRVVSISFHEAIDRPASFFEVELQDVVRTKHDALLNVPLVTQYLEQVAPLPFDASFQWSEELIERLSDVRLGNFDLAINGEPPLRRAFRDTFAVSEKIDDTLENLELVELTDMDGGLAAIFWLCHHSYFGAITIKSRVAGLRARVGNIQIGDARLFDDIFPEARFNGWCIGEVHILDPRIVPNARRDNFEQNIHFSNLTAQLEPLARGIARRARTASSQRNKAKKHNKPDLVIDKHDSSTTSKRSTFRQPSHTLTGGQKLLRKSLLDSIAASNLSDRDCEIVLSELLTEMSQPK